jgi:GWxTD domain-containing protein
LVPRWKICVAGLREPKKVLMSQRHRFLTAALAVLPILAFGAAHADRNAENEAARKAGAQALVERAETMLARGDIEGRREALQDLEQATLLDPDNPNYQLLLARTYYRVGFLKNARDRFERVAKLSPSDAESRYGLGQAWRRDWLKYLDQSSLARAVANLSACCRLRPDHVDGWLLMVPLLVEQGDDRAALNAAQRALEAADRPEAMLAVAYTAYRNGQVERAARSFDRAIPGLDPTVREYFFDLAPVASEADTSYFNTLTPIDQREFLRRFWKDLDPDLATPVNEAELEYHARVAHAYFLFYDARLKSWDQRGEVYVRYGAPGNAVYNPVGMNLNLTRIRFGRTSYTMNFPANILHWHYPELGMTVEMQDRTLNERYLLPISMESSADPVPNPDVVGMNPDQFMSRSGRGVFPRLPPKTSPIPVRGTIARFETERGLQLFGGIEADGDPADSLWAEWVVMDTAMREVARARRSLSASACDPLERRVADFAAELPAGQYTVGLSVSDHNGGRGIYRSDAVLWPVRPLVALSDLVVSCGVPFIEPSGSGYAVRPEMNHGGLVEGKDPLTAYFEIYHLRPDNDGLARFEYVYTVSSAEQDERIWLKRLFSPRKEPDPIVTSREEQQVGALRRQFVSVPIESLPAGRYTLEVRVRDLVAQAEAVTRTRFFKSGVN